MVNTEGTDCRNRGSVHCVRLAHFNHGCGEARAEYARPQICWRPSRYSEAIRSSGPCSLCVQPLRWLLPHQQCRAARNTQLHRHVDVYVEPPLHLRYNSRTVYTAYGYSTSARAIPRCDCSRFPRSFSLSPAAGVIERRRTRWRRVFISAFARSASSPRC